MEELSSSTLLVGMTYADTPVVFPKDKHLFSRNSPPRVPLQVHIQEQCAPVSSPKTCTTMFITEVFPTAPPWSSSSDRHHRPDQHRVEHPAMESCMTMRACEPHHMELHGYISQCGVTQMRHKAYTLHDFIYIKLKSKGNESVVLQVQIVVSRE